MKGELRKLIGGGVSDEKIDEAVKLGICHLRKDTFETWMFPTLTQGKVREMSYFVGRENLDEALVKGRGAIILLTHFGFRKLILPALGYEGYKVHQIAAKPISLKKQGWFMAVHNKTMDIELKCEKALPVDFVYIDESLRPIFTALKNNEIIVIAIDGPIGHKRIAVKFLNRTAHLSPTSISLSLKTKAPVLPAFVVRQKNNRHTIIIEKPLSLQAGEERQVVMQEALNNFIHIFEKYVLAYPCHYVDWLYRAQSWPIARDLFIIE